MSKPVSWYIGSDNQVYVMGLRKDLPVSSLTGSGTTATLVCEAHGLSTNDVVSISNANPKEYNGDFAVTVTNSNTFTFTLPSSATVSNAKPAGDGPIRCGAYLSGATVSGALKDAVGVNVSGADAISFDYKTGSNGLYVGTLGHGVSLADGATYSMTITCTATTGEVLTEKLSGQAMEFGG